MSYATRFSLSLQQLVFTIAAPMLVTPFSLFCISGTFLIDAIASLNKDSFEQKNAIPSNSMVNCG